MEKDILLLQKKNKCLALPGTEEVFPFGAATHVLRLAEKMFALIHRMPTGELYMSLKCDPAKAEILMQEYRSIMPGYHLNKQHWITIVYHDDAATEVEAELEQKLIEASYRLVFYKLTKKKQQAFRLKYGGELFDKSE